MKDGRRRPVALLLRVLARTLRVLALGLVGLLIAFEEWGWEPLQRALARLAQWPPLRRVEDAIAALGPRAALAVFLPPMLLLLPVKIGALWLIGRGHALLGTLTIVGAKVVGTALVARLFTLTRPALLELAWFARLYGRWAAWKEALLARLRASPLWRLGHALGRSVRERWARWRAALFGR